MKRKNAFTLVELLVVITIIGILSSLITVAVGGARRAARKATITMEMNEITIALDRYKSEFGEYPPDLSDTAAVLRHVKKRWPRFQLHGNSQAEQLASFLNAASYAYRNPQVITLLNTLSNGDLTISNTSQHLALTPFDHSSLPPTTSAYQRDSSYVAALPLWLGGFPNQDGIFSGFSADPQAPFGRVNGSAIDGQKIDPSDYPNISLGTQDPKGVFMELTVGKNVRFVMTDLNNIVFPCIVNELRNDLPVPYVYFRPRTNGGPSAYISEDTTVTPAVHRVVAFDFSNHFNGIWNGLGYAVPYAKAGDPFNGTNTIWFEADSFQLIHPGLDGKFGTRGTKVNDLPFQDDSFRSIKTDAVENKIGKDDFDNMTNFSNGSDLKTIID